MKYLLSLLVLGFVMASTALAHPGHGPMEHGLSHFAASPFHVVALLIPAALFFAIGRSISRPLARRVAYSGAVALFALAVIEAFRVIH